MTVLYPRGTDPVAIAGDQLTAVPGSDTLAGTFDAFAQALRLPKWFGRNLDALYDSLRDLPDGTGVVWDGGPLRHSDPAGYRAVLAVLGDLAVPRPDLRTAVIR